MDVHDSSRTDSVMPTPFRERRPFDPSSRKRAAQAVAGVLALVGVLMISPGSARAQTSSLDFDDTQNLEGIGRLIEQAQQTAREIRTGGFTKQQQGVSTFKKLIELPYNLLTRDYATILLPTSDPNASGSGTNISRDGLCVVGYLDNGLFTPYHALRWIVGVNSLDLGTLDPSNNASRTSFATDANQDCSVVVGFSDLTANGAIQHAFRWTSGGMVDIGAPANGGPNSRAFGVSSNGTVVVGDADFPAGAFTRKGAFRWAGGSFTDLFPGVVPSLATAVSADGTVVVGQVGTSTASSAFRWFAPPPPAQPVMQPIEPLPGHTNAAATAVSDNGKIIAGISHPTFLQYQGPVLGWNQGTAFRWTQAAGIQELRQVLADNGIDMTGVTLVSVTGMSPDGQWIQGKATTAQTGPNETVAFIAQVCDADIGGPCSTAGAAPFTLGAAPNQLNVSAGNSGATTITVTPDAGFAQPVSFACSGLPQGAACSFNPATVTPAGGPVNTTLTISTDGGAVALLAPDGIATMLAYMLTPFALFATVVFVGGKRFDPYRRGLWTGVLLILIVVATASCNGDSSSPPPVTSGGGAPATGTPAGTSAVTVTATSGAGNSGVPITLTVTR